LWYSSTVKEAAIRLAPKIGAIVKIIFQYLRVAGEYEPAVGTYNTLAGSRLQLTQVGDRT
jgi:hypothetical protein